MDKEDKKTNVRLNVLIVGSVLLSIFLVLLTIACVMLIAQIRELGFRACLEEYWKPILLFSAMEFIIFWIGIVMIYITGAQLGIKWRVIGALCGMIPVVNIIVLIKLISVSFAEAAFEKKKLRVDQKRKNLQICKTKYPLFMVHGVFFRDYKHFNYWGRVPAELIKNGATIYYGDHQSAAAVEDSAEELAKRIRQIISETGCEKLNVIAHSKGGLDMRMAIAREGIAPYIASITTVCTPHRGCEFADYLLYKAPEAVKDQVANAYNSALRKLGDPDPDFIAGVTDLTAERCREMDAETSLFDYQKAGIYTHGVGSAMKKASGGQFPLNMSYHLVNRFDGKNDGLVGDKSSVWGQDYTFLENNKKRGISHGDMIDLNRENIPGFDVREFYVKLVEDLKNRGL